MELQPRISALRPTNRDPNRVTVKVDGKAVGTLSVKLIGDLGLSIGQTWTTALNDQLADLLLYDKAMRSATRALARRAMSSGMVDQKLRKAGHSDEVRQQVIDRLVALELLDDEAFGRSLIRETLRAKPAGRRLLEQKLWQKGVDRGLSAKLLDECENPSEESRDELADFAAKKLYAMRHLDADTRRRRLQGQLMRRGFDYDAIKHAVEAAEARLASEVDE